MAATPRSNNGTTQRTEDLRDLGFGSVVSNESRERLLNRDGTFNVQRRGLHFWSSMSLYHSLLTMSWGRFLLLIVLFYGVLNLVFAFAYLLCGPDGLVGPEHADRFTTAFFFSIHTSATIGYGNVSPGNLAANIVVTVEAFTGLLAVALITGMVFARFSRPTARVMFSRNALITPYRGGGMAFQFRIVNTRSSELIEVEVRLLLSLFQTAADGTRVRRFYTLELERSKVAFFPLSWTVVHPIADNSPLYNRSIDELQRDDAEFLVLLTGVDETFSQSVHARSSYKAHEILLNEKFDDIFVRSTHDGELAIDVDRLHNTIPVETQQQL